MSERICPQCGKQVTSRHKNVRFCSLECSAKHNPKYSGERTCPICQTVFPIKYSNPEKIFCGRKCYHESMKRREIKQCVQCSSEFEVTISGTKNGRGRFCSSDCFHQWHTVHMLENPSNPRNKVECRCETCGKAFSIWPSHLQREGYNLGRFCSRPCKYAWQRTIRGEEHPLDTKITCICQWCQREYRAKKVYLNTTKFCSRSCQGAWMVRHTQSPTSIEISIKSLLDNLGIDYTEQEPMSSFSCDFFIPSARLVIECDGDYWHSLPKAKARDKRKDKWLAENNYNIVRLPEHKINKDIEWCKQQIQAYL